MILNLAAAFLAASPINGPTANRASESVNEANISEICVGHAIDLKTISPSKVKNKDDDSRTGTTVIVTTIIIMLVIVFIGILVVYSR